MNREKSSGSAAYKIWLADRQPLNAKFWVSFDMYNSNTQQLNLSSLIVSVLFCILPKAFEKSVYIAFIGCWL